MRRAAAPGVGNANVVSKAARTRKRKSNGSAKSEVIELRAYLAKPVDPARMLAVLEAWLEA